MGPTDKEIYRVDQLVLDARDGFLVGPVYRSGNERPKTKVLVFDGVPRQTRAGKWIQGKYQYI